MQINRIDNTGFGRLNSKYAEHALFCRLKNPEKLMKFQDISHTIDKYPLSVELNEYGINSLKATISDETGKVIYKTKENPLRGLFNLSPNKFMKKLLKTVYKIKHSSNSIK